MLLHLLLPLAVFAASSLVRDVSGLRLKMLQVPESVTVGEVARLVCVFDEEQDDLYSVKWYKDDVEFFRFLPNDRPANQFFEIGDVDVDMSRSSNGTVYLQNTSLTAEGTYRCEVSADAPSFQSISLENFMKEQDKLPALEDPAQRVDSSIRTISAAALMLALFLNHWAQ